ncbi:ABC transporter ATP-binding protein [Brucella intermedia]|uniref:ABC transporter ATP-binding protein n=1 Tax=Brucella intermedia TaxID=94625 RepID=UPI00224A9F30|nr:ABC transporter ATP-binding protein [Brucella intermedia]
MQSQSSKVQLVGLSKLYGHHAAVDQVSLDIAPGSLIALLGPSGCGKTTCLRMMSGLVEPSSGEILIDGQSVTKVPVHRRNIGMLFQSYALFPHLTVEQNVMFGLHTRGIKRAAASERAQNALSLVQLLHLKDRYPTQLSGGQQQRVALARAIVIEPSMLLLDEPLGALDKNLRESMQVELRSLQSRLGITTVMVTHDQDEALTMADQIVIMNKGKLEQIGSPTEVYQRPTSVFVANFVGASNLMSGRVQNRRDGKVQIEATSGVKLVARDTSGNAEHVTVSVRPEEIILSTDKAAPKDDQSYNSVQATVEQVVYRGFARQYYMRLPSGHQIVAFDQSRVHDGSFIPEQGSLVQAHWSIESNHVIAEKYDDVIKH